ncbi:unnamed protein product [Owenia fusiformis]|uniref:WSC domain-containing protein n=1 Tax=Owenia fusiformis TaxID=6347 RepID=A0A8S4NAP9_OWEFU|nr:unnamed protein product [Owenia fusiformis]
MLLEASSDAYIGCFKVDSYADLPYMAYNSDLNNTPERCSVSCSRAGYYKYAGATLGQSCYCTNNYGEYSLRPDAECRSICPGDSTQKCGGLFRLSFYQTSLAWTLCPSTTTAEEGPCKFTMSEATSSPNPDYTRVYSSRKGQVFFSNDAEIDTDLLKCCINGPFSIVANLTNFGCQSGSTIKLWYGYPLRNHQLCYQQEFTIQDPTLSMESSLFSVQTLRPEDAAVSPWYITITCADA